ncbi:NUDIX hydrolase [Caminicella sporogenes]|uniref:NUDIX hydrolase n=1 Tax=Caminicella sporogenes TaxID=166485 RepID=UPI0025416810|nr:CoA pyrophosphatase [Caminicella sporogenes]WIF94147.1 CoA pyrophosphatase [Caminicella sporogenes]
MNIDSIYKKFKNRNIKPEGRCIDSAVLIPIIERNNKLHILFEIRSKKLNTQPGEICFPGGKIEKYETPLESSIRETCEELNIDKSNIKIIGQTDYILTPFNLIIFPFIGQIKNIEVDNINFNSDEVDSIFTVPLQYFLNNSPDVYYIKTKLEIFEDFPFHKIQNGRFYNFRVGTYPIYFYEYKNYIIWGITARIVNNFVNILNKNI